MAHPMKAAAESGHNAKIRALTRHYGSASGPDNNILAPEDKFKAEGPEDAVGFGADSANARARGDRPARKSVTANPVATYKKGGKVKHRAWGGPMSPTAPVAGAAPNMMNQIQARDPRAASALQGVQDRMQSGYQNMMNRIDQRDPRLGAALQKLGGTGGLSPFMGGKHGGRIKKRADGGSVSAIEEANKDQSQARAHGGRTRKKGGTHVNVIVAPHGGPPAMPPPMAPPMAGAPPMPPKPPMPPMGPAGPMGASPMAGGPGPGPVIPPGLPPPGMMPPRAKGGRVHHMDAKEDKALIKRMLAQHERKEMKHRAHGGRLSDDADHRDLVGKSLKDQGLRRSNEPIKEGLVGRARGGKVGPIGGEVPQLTGYDAGAVSGPGRLEKIENYGHRASHGRPQPV